MSLNKLLNFRDEDRILIINCDDLGSSHSANKASYQAMTHGLATSASLMVPCPWAAEAASMFEGLPLGVHLTLTSEYAGYRWRSLTGAASLTDTDGFLHATTELALHQQKTEEVRAECCAQVEAALAWGVDVTHIDTHMNVLHGNRALFAIYLDIAEEFAVPIRLPYHSAFPAREMAATRGILSVDHQMWAWPRPTREVIYEECPTMPCGVTELFTHPVLDGEELRGYDLHHADIRAHDATTLVDPKVEAMLDHLGVKRISYLDLRIAQRNKC